MIVLPFSMIRRDLFENKARQLLSHSWPIDISEPDFILLNIYSLVTVSESFGDRVIYVNLQNFMDTPFTTRIEGPASIILISVNYCSTA